MEVMATPVTSVCSVSGCAATPVISVCSVSGCAAVEVMATPVTSVCSVSGCAAVEAKSQHLTLAHSPPSAREPAQRQNATIHTMSDQRSTEQHAQPMVCGGQGHC